ncbi:MAG TPA: GNAT family N-acetyltransferase [Brevundimonas sp.]|nr:GNAT family N-acetyltransferase [Brevundimonas sp.]
MRDIAGRGARDIDDRRDGLVEAEADPQTRSMSVAIVPFRPDHAAAWAALNEAWIAEGGFAVEAKDRTVIDDPQGAILDRGGRIFMAERDGETIGCCALMAMADGGFEVAKMTVSPAARGLGLGRRLLEACEAAARAAGAPRLYLETNASLKPAGALYRAFGFVDLPPRPSPYARADVWMEKPLR